MSTPPVPRRHFIGRVLAAIAGGAWLDGLRKAEATTTGPDDQPFLGEIRIFGGDFEPYGWRFCDGRILAIADYPDLYNLIGTTYGGDGLTTYALPDLRSRVPVHASTIQLGELGGNETVLLSPQQSPYHTHGLQGGSGFGIASGPAGRVPSKNGVGAPHYGPNADSYLASTTLVFNGGSQPHDNIMPSLCVNFIICIEGGIFPPRN